MRDSESLKEAMSVVVEWDEYGQGYSTDGGLIVCICGATRVSGDWSDHYCPADVVEENV